MRKIIKNIFILILLLGLVSCKEDSRDKNILPNNEILDGNTNIQNEKVDYSDAIQYCVSNGIILNTHPSEFSPKDNLTKELLANIIFKLENSPTVSVELNITDVEKGRWFQRAVYYVVENNIMTLKNDNSFGVGDNIFKVDFANALWRYAGIPESNDSYLPSDDSDISSDMIMPVCWAIENNIILLEDGAFKPNDLVSREMTAYAIMNLLKIKKPPFLESMRRKVDSIATEAEFVDRIKLSIEGKEGEAIVKLMDSKPTRQLLSQLPLTVNFVDFGKREKFARVPIALSEDEALLSGYEIGDFSYGTAFDCMIIFYEQDNEIIDGVIKMGSFESGIELFKNHENARVTISIDN